MKTVKKNSEIKRVDNVMAVSMVKDGWSYCPKSEWKSTVRQVTEVTDATIPQTTKVATPQVNKKQKRKNDKLVEKLVGTEPKKKGKKE